MQRTGRDDILLEKCKNFQNSRSQLKIVGAKQGDRNTVLSPTCIIYHRTKLSHHGNLAPCIFTSLLYRDIILPFDLRKDKAVIMFCQFRIFISTFSYISAKYILGKAAKVCFNFYRREQNGNSLSEYGTDGFTFRFYCAYI